LIESPPEHTPQQRQARNCSKNLPLNSYNRRFFFVKTILQSTPASVSSTLSWLATSCVGDLEDMQKQVGELSEWRLIWGGRQRERAVVSKDGK
jgi:hypothetical protein